MQCLVTVANPVARGFRGQSANDGFRQPRSPERHAARGRRRYTVGVDQRTKARFWRTSQSMTTGCCWPLLPVRPPRDGTFFVRSPAGVNGATLQENARRRVPGWPFAVTSRLVFQSRGPVEDDGNGRGLSLAGLGICGHREALSDPPYIAGKEGESRDSWRRRLPSFPACVL